MNIYTKVKHNIIKNNPDVIDTYTKYINNNGNKTVGQKIKAYSYLTKLLLSSNQKTLKVKNGEYEDCGKIDIESIKGLIDKNDVISFDVFDTLVLRNVEKPEDIFHIVGNRLDCNDFYSIRKRAEDIALKHDKYYVLKDIYHVINKISDISGIEGTRIEYETEIALCTANKFIMQLYEYAKSKLKKILIVTDTYWDKEHIENLLSFCGYRDYDKLFVSSENKKNKKDGTLFDDVKLYVENELNLSSVLHIGDNFNSDYENSKKAGFDAWHYPSVYEKGKKYRAVNGGKSIAVSVSNSIINNEIHCGYCDMSPLEQYGFIYGGPFVGGFTSWLNQIAEDKKIDKMLFLSRDARIFYDAYNSFYKKIDNEYVYISRAVSLLLSIDRYPLAFVDKVIKPYAVNGELTVKKVLAENSLVSLEGILKENGIDLEDKFTLKHINKITNLIILNKQIIIESNKDLLEAAKQYWKKVIGDKKTILLVDDGFHSTIFISMKYFLSQVCGLDIKLYSAQIGTFRDKFNQAEFDKGNLLSYAFSSVMNTDIASLYENGIEVAVTESMLSDDIGSLKKYEMAANNEIKQVFYEKNGNGEMIKTIHKGIMEYLSRINSLSVGVAYEGLSGVYSLKEILNLLKSNEYINNLIGEYIYTTLPGVIDSDKKIKEMFKAERYI